MNNIRLAPRRSVSGILVIILSIVLVLVGFGVVSVMFFDIADTSQVVDNLEIYNPQLTQLNSGTFVSANIKNMGNTEFTSITLRVMADTDTTVAGIQPFDVALDNLPLSPSMTDDVYAQMLNSTNQDMRLPIGNEFHVLVIGETAGGSQTTNPVTVRVR